MSETHVSDAEAAQSDEMRSGLIAHLIIQQANMAMMMMGKTPHPETGQSFRDLQTAKLFIDTLEMLEGKTRGNLSPAEQNVLKQTLMTVRMAFVEAANAPATCEQPSATAPAAEARSSAPSPEQGKEKPAPAEESHKKFSKKY